MMKLLPKLPLCPHCGAVYRYREVRATLYKKEIECYHCKKQIKIRRSGFITLLITALLLWFLTDLFAIMFIKGLNIILLYSLNLIITVIAILLRPYFLDYK